LPYIIAIYLVYFIVN